MGGMPAAASDYLSILNAVSASINGLGLTFKGQAVTPQVKKIEQWLEGISQPALPTILIVPQPQAESVEPWQSEGLSLAKYFLTILSIAAGNRDAVANLDIWLSWRQQERRLFQWTISPQVLNVFFVEFVGDPPLLKDPLLKNFDVQGFGMRYWQVEGAS